jgi:hypothetical protein
MVFVGDFEPIARLDKIARIGGEDGAASEDET